MKVLVATKETQGQRASDFSFVPEGELLSFVIECDLEADGSCGCMRSMAGIECHGCTTTLKVAEVAMTVAQFQEKLRACLLPVGFSEDHICLQADVIREAAACFPTGAILEKRRSIEAANFGLRIRRRSTITHPGRSRICRRLAED
ncbi:MAG TPA: hypothetical protein VEV17_18605 [Bryobacteraceae bacterium]|nr:hypothetical protein [Bryobacteraceae bacterium]